MLIVYPISQVMQVMQVVHSTIGFQRSAVSDQQSAS